MNWLEYESEEAPLDEIQIRCDDIFKRYGIRVQSMSNEEIRGI